MKKHLRKILIGSDIFLVIYSAVHGFWTLKQAEKEGKRLGVSMWMDGFILGTSLWRLLDRMMEVPDEEGADGTLAESDDDEAEGYPAESEEV